MASTPVRYFATAFFSPFYFAPLSARSSMDPTLIGGVQYGDKEAFEAIIAILKYPGVFADVVFGLSPDQRANSADVVPLAMIVPDSWNEWDDADPCVPIRQVSYLIYLIVRDEDAISRFVQIERLTAITQDALNQSDLGGGCLAPLTVIRRGELKKSSTPPEQWVVLEGEFSYLIPSMNSHGFESQ